MQTNLLNVMLALLVAIHKHLISQPDIAIGDVTAIKVYINETKSLIAAGENADPTEVSDHLELMAAVCAGYAKKVDMVAEAQQNVPTVEGYAILRARLNEVRTQANDLHCKLAEKRLPIDVAVQRLSEAFATSNAELIEETNRLEAEAAEVERELRDTILADYAIRGEKQVCKEQGLSIRVNKSYQYDEIDAVNFAIERNTPEVLQPRKKEFNKLMSVTPQPFCKVIETACAVVAKEK